MLICTMSMQSSKSKLEETPQVKQPKSFNRYTVRERKGQRRHTGDKTIKEGDYTFRGIDEGCDQYGGQFTKCSVINTLLYLLYHICSHLPMRLSIHQSILFSDVFNINYRHLYTSPSVLQYSNTINQSSIFANNF